MLDANAAFVLISALTVGVLFVVGRSVDDQRTIYFNDPGDESEISSNDDHP